MKKSFKMSDAFLGRIINIIQESMITGTDVLDLFREMEMKPSVDDPHMLVLTDDYTKRVDAWHKQIEEMLMKRKADLDENQAGRVMLQGTSDEIKHGDPIGGTFILDPSLMSQIDKKKDN